MPVATGAMLESSLMTPDSIMTKIAFGTKPARRPKATAITVRILRNPSRSCRLRRPALASRRRLKMVFHSTASGSTPSMRRAFSPAGVAFRHALPSSASANWSSSKLGSVSSASSPSPTSIVARSMTSSSSSKSPACCLTSSEPITARAAPAAAVSRKRSLASTCAKPKRRMQSVSASHSALSVPYETPPDTYAAVILLS
mmetsp:Transcript_15164/g.49752  ORF Transcript_15164/g.49752 Transcript_15164/m.49752 type:complete len:200 (+) Transcript_15164:1902-2501(+)